ncbi:rod shape-determining protein MreC [Pelovirga terrestris]|uniref:Cell shape-determining protein MreC n=1 Tax=Pelovirga terrestris TaxID=2771352 RepID=A0A8J6QPE2_9BACT|nr:rod shape-determining protein MreC [Pelovirga terrestris]MBD1399370.1 rod shape-determining protein MreC [Pelovirga terrestris]
MRDLFNRYRFYLLAMILLLATLILYSYNIRQKSVTTFFERAVLSVTAPFQLGIDGAVSGVVGVWRNYLWLIDTRQRNLELTAENQQLRARLNQIDEVTLQNQRLRKLLAFVDDLDRAALPAQVIGEDVTPWARTIVIDKGTRSGLRHGLAVVAAEGVVGRVIKTSPHSSRVLLITDPSSAVAALIQSTRSRGILRGHGERLSVEYMENNATVQPGDLLVTSGMGGVFPKGLPLARVVSMSQDDFDLFQRIEALPAADFSRLEEVLVILGEDR